MNHTIVAMVGAKIVRVQCNTCKSTHNHHPLKSAAEPRTSTRASGSGSSATKPRQPKSSPADAELQEWTLLAQDIDPDKVRTYAMDSRFRVNDPVRHPVFGLGIVRRVAEGKAEILFEGGKKLLKCG
jgi:hypothetical protein